MVMSVEEVEAAMIKKASNSPKSQLSIKDFTKCDPDRKFREIGKIANALVIKGGLTYHSSGSSTSFVHPDRVKDEEGSEGVN
jgi:hypothetical protein